MFSFPPTVQNLIDETLSLVDEPSNTTVGQYDDGAGNVIKTTAQTVAGYLQVGAAYLGRTCLYYPCTASRSLAQSEIAAYTFPLGTIQDAQGSYVWKPVFVAYDGVQLTQATDAQLTNSGANLLTDAPGVPVNWYSKGNMAIRLYPRNADAGVIVVDGAGVPPVPSDVNELVTWCQADQAVYLTYYAARMLAMRNLPEDNIMSGKVPTWTQELSLMQQQMRAELAAQSPEEAVQFFGEQTSAPQQAQQGG